MKDSVPITTNYFYANRWGRKNVENLLAGYYIYEI